MDVKKDLMAEMAELNALFEAEIADAAERFALQEIDALFANATMVAPPPDFVTRFETRLERRITRRRSVIGVLVIGVIMVFAAGLLTWVLATSGINAVAFVNSLNVMGESVNLFGAVTGSLMTMINAAGVLFAAAAKITRYPAYWMAILVSVGVVLLWVQVLRWTSFNKQPVRA